MSQILNIKDNIPVPWKGCWPQFAFRSPNGVLSGLSPTTKDFYNSDAYALIGERNAKQANRHRSDNQGYENCELQPGYFGLPITFKSQGPRPTSRNGSEGANNNTTYGIRVSRSKSSRVLSLIGGAA